MSLTLPKQRRLSDRRVGATDIGVDRTKIEGVNMISAAFPYQKQRRRVLGSEMAYVEVGEGDPIVLLHGNPTSSYLWQGAYRQISQQQISPKE
jgi:hypothetical protein